jgi:hypothetical protein
MSSMIAGSIALPPETRSAPAFRPAQQPDESRPEAGHGRASSAPARTLPRDSIETVPTQPARLRLVTSSASANSSRRRITATREIGKVAAVSP